MISFQRLFSYEWGKDHPKTFWPGFGVYTVGKSVGSKIIIHFYNRWGNLVAIRQSTQKGIAVVRFNTAGGKTVWQNRTGRGFCFGGIRTVYGKDGKKIFSGEYSYYYTKSGDAEVRNKAGESTKQKWCRGVLISEWNATETPRCSPSTRLSI